MRYVRESHIPNLLQGIASKFGVMFERVVLLGYPSHKCWDENLTPDFDINATRKVANFMPLGSGRLASGFWFGFDDESLLYYIIRYIIK